MSGNNLNKNQNGIVSIMISIVIMIVLSLIAVSFARIMRREARQALDRQLNTQAFYAAETAVNDAREAFYQGTLPLDTTDCISTSTGPLSENIIDANLGVEYTCVTIDRTPNSLIYDSIGTDRSLITELNPVNSLGAPDEITDLTISWEDPSGGTSFTATEGSFTPASSWGSRPGVLRVEIIPFPAAGTSRAELETQTRVFYLYPSTNGGTIGWENPLGDPAPFADQAARGEIVGGQCAVGNSPRQCNVRITGLPIGSDNTYVIRMLSIYQPVSVTLAATLNSGGAASFTGAQATIDATGKAGDVLRRIQERIPITLSYDYPEYAIDVGDDLCKRLEAEPSLVTVDPTVASIPSCEL